MRCSTCSAVMTKSDFLLSRGKWSNEKHFNRVCKFALARNERCINTKYEIKESLKWESQADKNYQ
jgi:hypothetical protein